VDLCWPGCVPCGIPFMKRLYPRGQVEPQLIRFARDYARLPFPVALDLDGPVAEH